MTRRTARLLGVTAILLATANAAAGAPWGWRGDGTGRYPDARPPIHWSDSKNVVWATSTPSWGNASPAIAGDRLFVTAEPTTVLCLRLADGALLWKYEVGFLDTLPASELPAARKKVAEAQALAAEIEAASRELDRLRREARKRAVGPDVKAKLDEQGRRVAALKDRHAQLARYGAPEDIPTAGNASPSPATDGSNVFVYFGNHVAASLTRDGALRWARHLPPEGEPQMHGFTHGRAASPILVGKTLLLPLNKLHALDADSGRTRFVAGDYLDYGTPALARIGDEDALLTPDGRAIGLRDGRLLGSSLPFVYYVGPVAGSGVGYWAGNTDSNPPNHAEARAVELRPPFKQRWSRALPDERQYATPLLGGDGALFVVSERARLTILDAATGAVRAERPLATGIPFPSPTQAGGYVYVSGEDGVTVVLEAKAPYREVARNTLAPFRATPVFVGRRMYVRALDRVYCIEERSP